MWPTDHSCDILVKNVPAFCPFPKSLSEAKLKSFGLIAFVDEISKQPLVDCVMWLLVDSLFLKFIFKFHFTFQTQFSLPPLLMPLLSPSLPVYPIHSSQSVKPPMGSQHIKLREDQAPPRCIKVNQGIPPQGMDSNKLVHAPGQAMDLLPGAPQIDQADNCLPHAEGLAGSHRGYHSCPSRVHEFP